jgi:hypothetical protein
MRMDLLQTVLWHIVYSLHLASKPCTILYAAPSMFQVRTKKKKQNDE